MIAPMFSKLRDYSISIFTLKINTEYLLLLSPSDIKNASKIPCSPETEGNTDKKSP